MSEARRAIGIGRRGQAPPALMTGIGLGLLLALACAPVGRAQGGPPKDIINRPAPMPTDPIPTGGTDSILTQRQLNALNIERQKEMVSDANKLLKLAKELNDEFAATGLDTLTPDQLRKVARIEKLARSIKDRMAEGVMRPVPSFDPTPVNDYPRH